MSTIPAPVRQAAAPSPLYLDIARDLGIEVAVPASDVWTWRRLATRQADPQDEAGSLQQVSDRRKGYAKQARYASGRVSEIERLLLHLHGGPCDTDDGWIWFEAVCPFIVEAAEITKRSIYLKALGWAVRYLPRLVEDVGLFELAMLINVYAAKRSEAENDQADLGLPFVRWLPTNQDLRDLLRPTWAHVTGLQLKGWAAIDRPDEETLKKRATDLRRQRRHIQGVRPRETMNRTEFDDAMAAAIGKTRRTIQMWRKAGILDEKLRPYVEKGILDFARMSDPLRDTCRTDTFAKLQPANDDQATAADPITETSHVEIAAANDDTPTPAPTPTAAPLWKAGYQGKHMRMSAMEVKAAVVRHPALVDELQRHLDAIDEAMAKTPAEKHRLVRRNLLQDRNRLAHRERRAREAALAA